MANGFLLGGIASGLETGLTDAAKIKYSQGLLQLEQQRQQLQQQNEQRAQYMKLYSTGVEHLGETMEQLRIAHPNWTDMQLASNPAVIGMKNMLSQYGKNLQLPDNMDSVVAGFAARPPAQVTEGALARAKEGPQHQALVQSEINKNNALAGNPDAPDAGEGLGDKSTFNQRFSQADDKGGQFLNSLPGARGLNAKGLYDGTTPITAFSTRTGRGNTKSQRQQAIEDAETYGALIGKPFDINTAANRKISETAQNKADSATLTQLTQNREALSAFEETAKENTKVLIDLAKKIPDTGSPLLNRPLRALAKDAAGNANVAAFNLQLQSVKNELSRIITNPRLVGQLTDNARSEMNAALDSGATVGMIMKAYDTVQKDFQNRSSGLDKSIGQVKDRLSGKSKTTKTYHYNPETGELE